MALPKPQEYDGAEASLFSEDEDQEGEGENVLLAAGRRNGGDSSAVIQNQAQSGYQDPVGLDQVVVRLEDVELATIPNNQVDATNRRQAAAAHLQII